MIEVPEHADIQCAHCDDFLSPYAPIAHTNTYYSIDYKRATCVT